MSPMYVVMFTNGTNEDTRQKPIHTCEDRRVADDFCRGKNDLALRVMVQIECRELLMEHWRATHHDSTTTEHDAERERISNVLGIHPHVVTLGFDNEDQIDGPYWSVVEVPHFPSYKTGE